MAARSNLPIVLGVDTVTVEGRTLRWAAEQAHLEGHRLQLVTAAGPAFPVPRDHGRGSLLVGSTRLNLRRGAVLDWAREELRLTSPYVEVDEMFRRGSEHPAHPARRPLTLVVLGSRGRGSVRSHVLGSVALAVVRHAASGGRPPPGHRDKRTVVSSPRRRRTPRPCWHSPSVKRVFASATQGRPLRVRRAVGAGRHPAPGDLAETSEQHERLLAESLAGLREDFPDVDVSVQTQRGCRRKDSLAQQASGSHRGGCHPRGIVERLLAGSVSGSVLQHGMGRLPSCRSPSAGTTDDEGSSRAAPEHPGVDRPRSSSRPAVPHGAVPKRVDLPIENYEEGGRRFLRAYLPGADPDRDIRA